MSAITKLEGVHPQLIVAFHKISDAMACLGYPILVTDGVRTTAQQAKLYAQGRTTPGKIVTHCDGIKKTSPHQPKADGWGHAIDCCFLVDGKPSWDGHLPWKVYGEAAKALGLKWGGEFTTLVDRPHIELPLGMV